MLVNMHSKPGDADLSQHEPCLAQLSLSLIGSPTTLALAGLALVDIPGLPCLPSLGHTSIGDPK